MIFATQNRSRLLRPVWAIVLIMMVSSGRSARAEILYYYHGTNFDVQVSLSGYVGTTPLRVLTLTAIGTNVGGYVAIPSIFDSTNDNTGGTGITTTGNKLHQVYQHNAYGDTNKTPTLSMDDSFPSLDSTELSFDTHFLIHELTTDPLKDATVFVTSPTENRYPPGEIPYSGYGSYLRGGFFLDNAVSTSWDFAQLVVPDQTEVLFNFGLAGKRNEVPVKESVITSFLVPEPGGLALYFAGGVSLALYVWRRRKS